MSKFNHKCPYCGYKVVVEIGERYYQCENWGMLTTGIRKCAKVFEIDKEGGVISVTQSHPKPKK